MKTTTSWRRVIGLLVAVVLLAAACGDDSADDAVADANTGDAVSADGDSGGSESVDDPADESAADPEDPALTVPDVVGGDGSIDCDALQSASVDALSLGSDALSGAASDPEALEANFNSARAQFVALGENAPELTDEVTTVLAGLDVLADAFGEFGWDVSEFAANPSDALEFVELLGGDEIENMSIALSEISSYASGVCS